MDDSLAFPFALGGLVQSQGSFMVPYHSLCSLMRAYGFIGCSFWVVCSSDIPLYMEVMGAPWSERTVILRSAYCHKWIDCIEVQRLSYWSHWSYLYYGHWQESSTCSLRFLSAKPDRPVLSSLFPAGSLCTGLIFLTRPAVCMTAFLRILFKLPLWSATTQS